ncbi:MAG: MoxR family ATPase [candidate division WS1 bacterium]|jgi:MoxR-like ATPase|nr:MoxR family ATPase [candidate division WS1 bacterium]
MELSQVPGCARKIIESIETVIVGKHEAVELTVAGFLSGGHILIEDIPGVGKTMLAKTLAKSVGGVFKRVQFTPDLLPADVTGSSIFNQVEGCFIFREGPVFANVLLADEINRATPKAQAAMLEAMEEHQVTADGVTYDLPRPFFVMATENPIEYEGTYSLPEAQLDRFIMRVSLGYPSSDDEVEILTRQMNHHPVEDVKMVLNEGESLDMQIAIRSVFLEESLKHYIVDLVGRTRQHPDLELGSSPRGSLALMRCSQAVAAVSGRDYVQPDDIKRVAVQCLAHRMIVKSEQSIHGLRATEIVTEILRSVPVPTS